MEQIQISEEKNHHFLCESDVERMIPKRRSLEKLNSWKKFDIYENRKIPMAATNTFLLSRIGWYLGFSKEFL
jgi:ribosomal protein L13